LQNSPLGSSCVLVALIRNYSTSKHLNLSPEKSQILSCDTVVANEQLAKLTRDLATAHFPFALYKKNFMQVVPFIMSLSKAALFPRKLAPAGTSEG
jgi:hypothetical protein